MRREGARGGEGEGERKREREERKRKNPTTTTKTKSSKAPNKNTPTTPRPTKTQGFYVFIRAVQTLTQHNKGGVIVVGLAGPSGSGKTSLLSILGGRTPKGATIAAGEGGGVLFNGEPLTKRAKRQLGFVLQDDLLYESLTVYETLYFAAMLRLPKTMTSAQKKARVDEVIAALGLSRWSRAPAVSEPSRRRWAGFAKLIVDAYYKKSWAWYPVEALALEMSAAAPAVEPRGRRRHEKKKPDAAAGENDEGEEGDSSFPSSPSSDDLIFASSPADVAEWARVVYATLDLLGRRGEGKRRF